MPTELTLKWDKFGLTDGLNVMLGAGELVDVTIACQGHFLQAHKTILAACSQQFKEIFMSNPCTHPVIFMQDVKLSNLQALLTFMYTGEATIMQPELSSFMKTAESLRVSGLTSSESTLPRKVKPVTKRTASLPSKVAKKTRVSAKSEDPAPETTWTTEEVVIVDPTSATAVEEHEATEDPSCLETLAAIEAVEIEGTTYRVEREEDTADFLGDNAEQPGTSGTTTTVTVSTKGLLQQKRIYTEGRPVLVWGSDGLKQLINEFQCSMCERKMKSKNSLRAHMYKYHSGKDAGLQHKCEQCDKAYALRGGLLVHMRNEHGENAVPVTCEDCGKQYRNKMAHYKHVYAHHKFRILNREVTIGKPRRKKTAD